MIPYSLRLYVKIKIANLAGVTKHCLCLLKDLVSPPTKRSCPARVGVMTCTLNEASCIAFTVGALVDQVDLYVLIDTGSTDGTEELVRSLYSRQIAEKKLIVEQMGPLQDYDISIARNRAVEILQEHNVDYFVKVDGDDVFYDEGASHLVKEIRHSPLELKSYYVRSHELYQWSLARTPEWLQALGEKRQVFWRMNFSPAQTRVGRVDGARASGRWTDEARGMSPEGVGSELPGLSRGSWRICAAHYGWAKPVELKEEKIRIWNEQGQGDPRVDTLHLVRDGRKPLRLFTQHPEVIERKIDQVLAFFESRGE